MTLVQPRPVAPSVPPPDPAAETRARLRRWLYLAGLVPLALALAFGLKVVVMGHHDQAGQRAWSVDDPAAAMEQWTGNRFLNVLQPWIAPFDTGNAAYGMKDWDRAIGDYRDALDKAPRKEQCTVRINLSLTQEAVGDEAAEGGDLGAARSAWSDALATLNAGRCPTHSGRGKHQSEQAESQRQRLEQKLHQQPPPKSRQQPQQQKKHQGGSDGSDRQQKDLDKRNGQGQRYKNQYKDLEDYGGFSDQPQW